MRHLTRAACLAATFGVISSLACAQGSIIYKPSADQPANIDAESLSVDNLNGTATFSGHVVFSQGTVRMRCATLTVRYHAQDPGRHGEIDSMECNAPYVIE
jgi:lipopolysaccharide export system protein LptA